MNRKTSYEDFRRQWSSDKWLSFQELDNFRGQVRILVMLQVKHIEDDLEHHGGLGTLRIHRDTTLNAIVFRGRSSPERCEAARVSMRWGGDLLESERIQCLLKAGHQQHHRDQTGGMWWK